MHRTHLIILASVLLFVPGCGDSEDKKQVSQKATVEASLNKIKQKLFDKFHPIGTAIRVQLHEVTKKDPSGQVTYRFTIFWEGPFTKDGFTKVEAVFDYEVKRWVRYHVLETNGVTTQGAAEGAGSIIGGLLDSN